jgi:CO/xanthine dehydrogenase Mo-binding subunit
VSFVIGQNVHSIDIQNRVTGQSLYTGDIKLPGILVGKVLRSTVPHARIRKLEVDEAMAVPGVHAVLTADNLPVRNPYYGAYVKDQPIVAINEVRYYGEIVAAVAAENDAIAEKALQKIEVQYEELPAVFTVEEALERGAPLLHPISERPQHPKYFNGARTTSHEHSNICSHFSYERGDTRLGFQDSDFVVEDTFFFPSTQHYPLEPHISVAKVDDSHLTIWTATQTPFPLREALSSLFDIPLSRVRVIVSFVGGGYGSKSGIKTEAISVALSKLTGHPVRLALSGDENFKTVCQPKAKITIKTGVRKDGLFVARQCGVFLNIGAYANSGPTLIEKAGYRAHGPYRIPNVLTDAYCIYTNTVPGTAFRGFGGPQVAFAYESHLDVIANELKIDPLQLRLLNLLDKGEEYAPGDTPIDCDLKAGLKRVARSIGWMDTSKQPIQANIKRGKGLACVAKDGGGANKSAYATVKILGDGSVLCSFGSVEIGQGIRTALLQVVAEEFGIPFNKVEGTELDTLYTPFDQGTHSSSAMSIMGRAVLTAAQNARQQIIDAVASKLVIDKRLGQLHEGRVIFPKTILEIGEAMRLCFGNTAAEIVGTGFFRMPATTNAPLGYLSAFWEVGIGGAEIEIDEMTGQIRILKYISLTDAGKMINPLRCRGQDEGAAIFGMGLSLFEELIYEEGRLLNQNLVDYRLPRFRDLPESFTTDIVEEGGGPGPHGAKGLGEGGVLPVAPALCNAVYDAAGVRIKEIPLTGERVWSAIQNRVK